VKCCLLRSRILVSRELDELVEAIIHEMLEPEKHGLRRPKD
jgi:hypothetical protein